MSLYFSISDVLGLLERSRQEDKGLDTLIDVSNHVPDCGGYPEDAFILSSSPKILDITSADSAPKLATLLDETPLYRVNMELALDAALTERHVNATVQRALRSAFAGMPLPNTVKGAEDLADSNEQAGSLRHPMIGHIGTLQLAEIYVRFLRVLGPGRRDFSFDSDIMGKHDERFLNMFDGYIHPDRGKVKAGLLIGFGMRIDHDTGHSLEGHVQRGQASAAKMRITEPHELIWAWFEADNYQMRRCQDIHRIKIRHDLPRQPNWVRLDVLAFLEKEAMKQVFAAALMSQDAGRALAAKAPLLEKALKSNAAGQVDDLLQQLLAQIMNSRTPYTGVAGAFAEEAARRMKQARQSGVT